VHEAKRHGGDAGGPHSVEELALSLASSGQSTADGSGGQTPLAVDPNNSSDEPHKRSSNVSLPGELDIEGFTVASPSFLAREGWMCRSVGDSLEFDYAALGSSGGGGGGRVFFGGSSANDVAQGDSRQLMSGDPVDDEQLLSSDTSPLKLLRRQGDVREASDGGHGAGGPDDRLSPPTPSSTAQSVFASASTHDDGGGGDGRGSGGGPMAHMNSDDTDDDELDGRLSPPVLSPTFEAVGASATAPLSSLSWNYGVVDGGRDDDDFDGAAAVNGAGNAQGAASASDDDEEEELSLVYDAELNCWFDPVTHQYYELNV
jgi:hypothetical protein